jgi:hypothetical protein
MQLAAHSALLAGAGETGVGAARGTARRRR